MSRCMVCMYIIAICIVDADRLNECCVVAVASVGCTAVSDSGVVHVTTGPSVT